MAGMYVLHLRWQHGLTPHSLYCFKPPRFNTFGFARHVSSVFPFSQIDVCIYTIGACVSVTFCEAAIVICMCALCVADPYC